MNHDKKVVPDVAVRTSGYTNQTIILGKPLFVVYKFTMEPFKPSGRLMRKSRFGLEADCTKGILAQFIGTMIIVALIIIDSVCSNR